MRPAAYIVCIRLQNVSQILGTPASSSLAPGNCAQAESEMLSLAGELSSHDAQLDLSDLAQHLPGVSLDDTILNASDSKRDKIYKLLKLWKSANCSATEGSVAKLLTCLRQLNNPSINSIIENYGRSNIINAWQKKINGPYSPNKNRKLQ